MAKEMSEDPSQRFEAIVPRSIVEKFRRGVFIKHKEIYGHMNIEVSRALALHAERMIMESGSRKDLPVKNELCDSDDPPGFVQFAGVFNGRKLEEEGERQ